MMRTIEILLVIIIITGAFIIASLFAVLPSPRQVSPLNLRRLALTTLQALDGDYDLSATVFKANDDPAWAQLQIALSACLPPNIVYNLTVYEVQGGGQLYTVIKSISNAENLGVSSDAASSLVASSNVTFSVTPEKIGGSQGGGMTLYILNCSDSYGWWITGYTAQSLAGDLYALLSPYFKTTVMVQNTMQLGQILNNSAIQGETIQNAVVINTVGEAVPIPSGYYASAGVGYDDSSHSSYARYCHTLGTKVRAFNWTWVSIVGYPLYYVSNAALFSSEQNSWGIYGMKQVGEAGLNAFLRGLDNIDYNATWQDGLQWKTAWWQDDKKNWIYDHGWITKDLTTVANVTLSSGTRYYCNYYGIYPSPNQTATRALPSWIIGTYHLNMTTCIFDPVNSGGNWYAGAVYRHNPSGALMALGLTRSPDIRLTALGLLCDYKPRLYRSEYTAAGTSRLVVLQLGQAGGV